MSFYSHGTNFNENIFIGCKSCHKPRARCDSCQERKSRHQKCDNIDRFDLTGTVFDGVELRGIFVNNIIQRVGGQVTL